MLTTFAALAALCVQQEPLHAEGPLAWWEARLRVLVREDARHETFGSVGRRLWITRDDPRPGLRGQAHWLHHTPELADLLAIEFFGPDGMELAPLLHQRRWRPTDNAVQGWVGDAHLYEQRWITSDDVYVWRGTMTGPLDATVRVRSRLTPGVAGDRSRFATLACVAPEHGEVVALSRGLHPVAPDTPMFAEGEHCTRQSGSRGQDRKAGASGGAVLGSDFGGKRGHRASWRFGGDGRDGWTLLARVARAAAGPARWSVQIDDTPAGELACAPTGGWGGQTQEFAWARLDLPRLPDQPFDLTLQAQHDGANTNFDGLLLLRRDQAEQPPPPEQWNSLDPLRGALDLRAGSIERDGVPFEIAAERTSPLHATGLRPARPLPLPAGAPLLHALVLPDGAAPRLSVGDRQIAVPRAREPIAVALLLPESGAAELTAQDCVLLALTREQVVVGGSSRLRRGHVVLHGVPCELRLTVAGLPADHRLTLRAGERCTFTVALEFCGTALPGAATETLLAEPDPLAAHRRREAAWYARHCPRFECADPLLANLWTYRCFLLRHNLAEPRAGHLGGGPVFYEGRHGSWYPRVITFSTPHIVAEARWLADPTLWRGNVEAHLAHLAEDGELPNLLVDWTGFRYSNWIGAATVDALKVHPDPFWLRDWLPALVRNTEGIAALYDQDADGVLCTGDHYTTGMEFQPSFWFHDGYDNRKPQADLERPDLTAYVFGNARALAQVARAQQQPETAARLEALAGRLQAGALRKLWHGEDRFFYSVRERDDAPARAREVVGFYPFRFQLAPDAPEFRAALSYLVSPAEFWTAFPVASCSKQVPVYSAAVQRWPGPGGLVTACMWNGPTWPHANSLIADTMAVVLRSYGPSAVQPGHLGELLRSFAQFHCEDGEPSRPLLREYGDGETGVNWGCADYLHSTWLDLVIRHAAGLTPRDDAILEVRPLALGLPDFALHDVPYRGHRIGIRIARGRLFVTVDGRAVGEGNVAEGLQLSGVLDP